MRGPSAWPVSDKNPFIGQDVSDGAGAWGPWTPLRGL